MILKLADRVQWNNLAGTVTRVNIVNVKMSCQVTFDDGTIKAFFGPEYEQLTYNIITDYS
jgi:hypothetical protein